MRIAQLIASSMLLLSISSSARAESETHRILSGAEKSVADANNKQNQALEKAKRELDDALDESSEADTSADELDRVKRELQGDDSIDGDSKEVSAE